MSILLQCRHCGDAIGSVAKSDVSETMLGIDTLSQKEHEEMIEYKEDGTMVIQSICEQCEDTLTKYPEFHELHYFIH